jgi:outer membrane immunogenic protein
MKFRGPIFALISAAALACTSVGVSASEPAGRYAPFSWTGFYIGIHAGGASSDLDWALDYPFGSPPASSTFSESTAIAGGHLGLQRQFGNWVLGAELSLSAGFRTQTRENVDLFGGANVGQLRADIDWLLLGTGRIGYAWDRWQGYVKGGYAGAMINLSTDDNVPPDFLSSSERVHHGWTVGGGLEYAVVAGLVFGIEYNYVNLGEQDTVPVVGAGAGTQTTYDVDTTIHTITARLSAKLN